MGFREWNVVLDENASHRLMITDTWPPVGRPIWGRRCGVVGGGVLLGGAWRLSKAHTILYVLSASCLEIRI